MNAPPHDPATKDHQQGAQQDTKYQTITGQGTMQITDMVITFNNIFFNMIGNDRNRQGN
jgi:hypothetical protein